MLDSFALVDTACIGVADIIARYVECDDIKVALRASVLAISCAPSDVCIGTYEFLFVVMGVIYALLKAYRSRSEERRVGKE